MTKTRTDNPIPLPTIPFTDGEYRWKVRTTHIPGFYELRLQRKRKMFGVADKWTEVAMDHFNYDNPKRWSQDNGPEVATRIIEVVIARRNSTRPAIAGVYQP